MTGYEKTLWLAVFNLEISKGTWLDKAIAIANRALDEFKTSETSAP